MGWVRAKEEERETWKPECAWMAGKVARGAGARGDPFLGKKKALQGRGARGDTPTSRWVGLRVRGGGGSHSEEVGAHVCASN